jgi:hypothetical protein
MKYLFYFLVFTLISLSSCDKEKAPEIFVGKPMMVDVQIPKRLINPKLKFQFSQLDLHQPIVDVNLDQFKKYGDFYGREFTIYQVKNLDLLEDNQYISEIYLYFVDSTLHKIQALTTKNMADFFLSKYGGAKVVLKDHFNKQLVQSEGVAHRRYGKIKMNKNLSNYKLKWRADDRLISYQVDETAQKNFEALEELINLDNQQKIRIKPKYVFTIQSKNYNQLLAHAKSDDPIPFMR